MKRSGDYDDRERTRRASSTSTNRRPPAAPAREWAPFSRTDEWGSGFPFGFARPSDPSEPLLEVLLSAGEAFMGVTVPMDVPVSLPCPECRAQELWQRMFCFTCGGTGRVRTSKRMVLEIPPGIRSGSEFLVDAGDFPSGGIRVRVLVE
jgi:hypothetical protein